MVFPAYTCFVNNIGTDPGSRRTAERKRAIFDPQNLIRLVPAEGEYKNHLPSPARVFL